MKQKYITIVTMIGILLMIFMLVSMMNIGGYAIDEGWKYADYLQKASRYELGLIAIMGIALLLQIYALFKKK